MFVPNTTCQLYTRSDTQNLYGGYTYNDPITVPCAIVSMDLKVSKTSVRADSSASRGRAEEEVGSARLLFPASTAVKEGDLASVDGYPIEVIRIFSRHDVLGNIDHLQIDFRKGQFPS